MYNTEDDNWKKEESIPFSRNFNALAACHNVLYLFGGEIYQNNSGIPLVNTNSYIPRGSIVDIDGNIYRSVVIGNQVWLSENLRTAHYRNGDSIPEITDNTEWSNLSSGAYCNYNNDNSNFLIYGRLYNYYAAEDERGLCPSGWHLASDTEWKTLEMYLGMTQSGADSSGWRGTNQSEKLRETGTDHWTSPNSNATNETGFTALPGGCRDESGKFNNIQHIGYWWTSTPFNVDSVWRRDMGFNYNFIDRGPRSKKKRH